MVHAPGKLKEKIVTILERHIDQQARVSCDVFLPVVAHPDMEPRQIDVLIETGTLKRPTRTIVEVQDRKSKPTRGEFDGWLEKMSEVGAQHLMCVSKAGFPKSIIQKASNIGPSIRLFTLRQLEQAAQEIFPPTIMHNDIEVVTYGRLTGILVNPVHLYQMHPQIDPKDPPDPHFKMFKPAGKDYFVSPTEVTDWHLFAHPKNLRELPHNGKLFTLRYGYDCDPTNPWHFITKTGAVPMKRFEIQIELSVLSHPIEWEHNCYEQVGEGEIGWILKGSANYDGKDTIVYIPLRKEDDGRYFAGRPVTKSENAETFFGYGDIGYKSENFDQYLNPGQ